MAPLRSRGAPLTDAELEQWGAHFRSVFAAVGGIKEAEDWRPTGNNIPQRSSYTKVSNQLLSPNPSEHGDDSPQNEYQGFGAESPSLNLNGGDLEPEADQDALEGSTQTGTPPTSHFGAHRDGAEHSLPDWWNDMNEDHGAKADEEVTDFVDHDSSSKIQITNSPDLFDQSPLKLCGRIVGTKRKRGPEDMDQLTKRHKNDEDAQREPQSPVVSDTGDSKGCPGSPSMVETKILGRTARDIGAEIRKRSGRPAKTLKKPSQITSSEMCRTNNSECQNPHFDGYESSDCNPEEESGQLLPQTNRVIDTLGYGGEEGSNYFEKGVEYPIQPTADVREDESPQIHNVSGPGFTRDGSFNPTPQSGTGDKVSDGMKTPLGTGHSKQEVPDNWNSPSEVYWRKLISMEAEYCAATGWQKFTLTCPRVEVQVSSTPTSSQAQRKISKMKNKNNCKKSFKVEKPRPSARTTRSKSSSTTFHDLNRKGKQCRVSQATSKR